MQALANCLIVLPDKPITKIGSIDVPDGFLRPSEHGVVVSVGPECSRLVEPGSRVIYGETHSGFEIEHEGTTYLCMSINDVLAIEPKR